LTGAGLFLEGSPRTLLPDSREINGEKPSNEAKTCRKCGETKPPKLFRRNSKMRDGLSSWCAACHTEATRRWRHENPHKVEAYNASRRVPWHERLWARGRVS
jgi:hypothetical protein